MRAVWALMALAAVGASAQWDPESGCMKQTATVRTSMAVTNTDMILARQKFMLPPRGLMVFPDHRPSEEAAGLGPLFPGPSENGGTPGDPDVCVGLNYAVSATNGGIGFYAKSNGRDRRY